MAWPSALAIYVLFWVMSAFVVMPIGFRAANESEAPMVPGQAQGAPANFNPMRILMRTTIVATITFGLFYLNYTQGWITAEMLDFTQW